MSGKPPQIFDRALLVDRLKRSGDEVQSSLARHVAEDLADRLRLIKREFHAALLIAPFTEKIAPVIRETGRLHALECREPPVQEDLGLPRQSYDAIFDLLDLHAVNDVPGRLAQVMRALKPDGLFIGCLFAGESLTELRHAFLAAETELHGGASPRVAPMIDLREIAGLMQRAGFALPVTDLDRTTVRYGDPIGLIHDIARLGFSNTLIARSRQPVSRRLIAAAAAQYRRNFSNPDGRVRATIEIAWATGWSPHESQQKPLKPGSAKMRLADALKARKDED